MKALASLLLISATLAGSAAYALDTTRERESATYGTPPISLTRDPPGFEADAGRSKRAYAFHEVRYRTGVGATQGSRSCGSAWLRRGDPPCFLFPKQEAFNRFEHPVASLS